jgi:hypothetical protein
MNEINWKGLSLNPSAFPLLEKNMDKINWDSLSFNPNPNAIRLLEKNVDKVNWFWLSKNTGAISIIEKHMDKVNYVTLSMNSAAIHLLCKLDYNFMKENMREMSEELAAVIFHPKRLLRICERFGIEFDELMDLYC